VTLNASATKPRAQVKIHALIFWPRVVSTRTTSNPGILDEISRPHPPSTHFVHDEQRSPAEEGTVATLKMSVAASLSMSF
jgi:hypothetical protein